MIRQADWCLYRYFKITNDPNTKAKEKEYLTETEATSFQVSDLDNLSDKDNNLLKTNELEIDVNSEGTLHRLRWNYRI